MKLREHWLTWQEGEIHMIKWHDDEIQSHTGMSLNSNTKIGRSYEMHCDNDKKTAQTQLHKTRHLLLIWS